ncbi:MAG TPA: hypothetical protein VNO30_16545 [Kofleriaceae bacterium]|nr:hypothetical protein [Kofleriaceae bacterium]
MHLRVGVVLDGHNLNMEKLLPAELTSGSPSNSTLRSPGPGSQ